MVLCLTSAGLLVFSSSHMRYLGCMRCAHPPLVSREPHASRLHAIWTHPSFRLWSAAQASGNWLGSSAASNSAGGDVATAASAAMLPSVDALQAAVLGFEWASSIVDGGLPGGAGQLAPRRACSLLVRSAHALAGSTGLVPQLTSAPRDAMIDSCAHQVLNLTASTFRILQSPALHQALWNMLELGGLVRAAAFSGVVPAERRHQLCQEVARQCPPFGALESTGRLARLRRRALQAAVYDAICGGIAGGDSPGASAVLQWRQRVRVIGAHGHVPGETPGLPRRSSRHWRK